MQKWEYKTVSYSPLDCYFEDWLNKYGNWGWELVSCENGHCIFKQLKEEGNPEDE